MITLANPSSQFSFMHEMQAQSMDKISWIQRDTVPHSIIRKLFCRPPFSSPCRQFFRYPWAVKREGKMWDNSHTPVPARPRRFSATPRSLSSLSGYVPPSLRRAAASHPRAPRPWPNRPAQPCALLHPCAPSLTPRSRRPSLPNCQQMTQ